MILVTGATGHVGRAVSARLASLGHEVVAMVRDVRAARARLPAAVALRVADYDDVSALKRALVGIEDLVLISSDGEASAVMRHHRNVIDAARASSVRYLVFTSIVDTDELSRFYFAPVYRDAERRLSECGVPSTVLRCGLYSDFILEHWLAPSQISGQLMLPAGDGRVAAISRDDVAAAVAAVAHKPNETHSRYTITGDRALGFDEIAASYSEAIARPIGYRASRTDDYLALESARLEAPWPSAFSTLCASIAEGRYAEVSDDFIALIGRAPESFRDFLVRATSGTP